MYVCVCVSMCLLGEWVGGECRNHLQGFSAFGAKSCRLEGMLGLGPEADQQGLTGQEIDGRDTVAPLGSWEGLAFTAQIL